MTPADWLTLIVLLPLFGAMAAFVLPRAGHLPGILALAGTGLAVAMTAAEVARAGVLIVPLGGWGAALGIDLRADGLSVVMLIMTLGVGALASVGAAGGLGARGAPGDQHRQLRYYWPLWLLLLTGLNGVYLSTDIFNLYVMIEVIALAAVGLAVLSGKVAALRAGLEYMYASILGALMFLLGTGLVYLELGRLDIGGLAAAAPSPTLGAALGLMVVGLGLKTAAFPLHFWLPAAHANATAPVSALLSGLVIKAALFILLRLLQAMPQPGDALLGVIGLMGTGAVIWGGIQALRAERLKLMVAWSTVAQVGLILVALVRAGPAGLTDSWKAAVILMLAHGVAKAAMFLAVGRIRDEIGHDRIRDLDRAPTRPALAQFTFALAAISLIGLPPSLGFIGKWSLMEGALSAGYWHWVAVAMIGTLFSIVYFSRVLAGFLRFDRVRGTLEEHKGWAAADAAPLALAVAAVGLGLMAAPILSFLDAGVLP